MEENKNHQKSLVVGIDASRNRSGGAKSHLIGILSEGANLMDIGIKEIHLWSFRSLLDSIPDKPWLIKHHPKQLEGSLIEQGWWQYFQLPREAKYFKCDVLLYTDAAAFVNFHPCVVMSRDMLSFEEGEMQRFGISKARLRLVIIKYTQALGLKKADGVLFLTRYASYIIQKFTGYLEHVKVIPHGVSNQFRVVFPRYFDEEDEIKCIYVSNASIYKHQWHVIDAVSKLHRKGINISLLLAGGSFGPAKQLVDNAVRRNDPGNNFITVLPYVRHDQIPLLIANSNIFVFASSCENMPNTLVEGMASGLPIACSNRGPMPEVLRDGGVYFNPEDPISISQAIEKIIVDKWLREQISMRAKELSEEYSWQRCSKETFEYLKEVFLESKYIK